jgi:streptogramin lyase
MAVGRYLAGMLVACLLVLPGISQQFESINDRIPMETAGNIFQDSYGFIWIGTADGLIKSNGYQATRYVRDPQDTTTLSGNRIGAIYEDSQGRMIIGFGDVGANYFDRNTETATPIDFTPVIPDGMLDVYDIREDRAGVLWFGTDRGLISIQADADTTYYARYVHDDGDPYSISSNNVYLVLEDSKGHLWSGTSDGINLMDREHNTFTNYHTNPTFHDLPVMDIHEDQHGTLWVCPRFGPNRLLVWDEPTKTLIPHQEFVGKRWGEFRITFGHDNVMWISSRGKGALRFDLQDESIEFFDPTAGVVHGFREFHPLANITDKYGNIWFTGDIIHKWPASNKAISTIPSDGYNVLSVYADTSHIWFSTRTAFRWNRTTFEVEAYIPEPFPNDIFREDESILRAARVYSIKELSPSRLIFVTTRNVFIFDRNYGIVKEYPLNYGGPFRDIELVENGLWICGNQGRPIFFDMEGESARRLDIMNEVLHPNTVTKSRDGILWFGSSVYGLFSFNHETGETEHFHRYVHRVQRFYLGSHGPWPQLAGEVEWQGTPIHLGSGPATCIHQFDPPGRCRIPVARHIQRSGEIRSAAEECHTIFNKRWADQHELPGPCMLQRQLRVYVLRRRSRRRLFSPRPNGQKLRGARPFHQQCQYRQ